MSQSGPEAENRHSDGETRPPRSRIGLLWLAFGSITAALVVGAVISQRLSSSTLAALEGTTGGALASVEVLSRIGLDLERERSLVAAHILETDLAAMRGIDARIRDVRADYLVAARRYDPLVSYPGEAGAWRRLQQDVSEVDPIVTRALELSRKNRDDQAHDLLLASEPIFDRISRDLGADIRINTDGAEAAYRRAVDIDRTAMIRRFALWLIGLCTTIGTGVWVGRFFRNAERRDAQYRAALEDRGRMLHDLRQAALSISVLERPADPKTVDVLQSIVQHAKRLAQADYAAVGVGGDPSRPFEPWVSTGMSPAEKAAIAHPPRPVGVLGWPARHGQTVLLAHRSEHPESIALPAGHPEVDAFLAVPIRSKDRTLGTVYLARRPGAPPFTREQATMIELLAAHAAIAMENARLLDQLQLAVAAREEVIAVVSHDLKNPLGAISLREQILEGSQVPEARAHARSVRRSIATMERLIGGLLDMARFDAGQLELKRQRCPIADLVREVVELNDPLARDRRVQVEVAVPASLSAWIDRERIHQVLANLLGNAIKFTVDGTVTITGRQQGAEAIVSVADTGAGILPDVLPHVFDRFFTAGTGRAGTGLGLNIARRLVEAHGGRIWATSAPGKGSTFTVALPAASETIAAG